MALSAEAGWNQVAADWRVFIEHGSAVVVTNDNGRVVATAAMLPHGDRLAWISMVLVAPPYRRRGIASWLLRFCVDALLAKGLVPVLDATAAGRPLYLGLGFTDAWGLHRLTTRAAASAGIPGDILVRSLRVTDWPEIAACDEAVFGADRGALLRHLARRLPPSALVAESAGRLVGFLLGRDGRTMCQLGPLVAENETIARALLGRGLAAVAAQVAIDVPDRHTGLAAWLASLGFAPERSLTRMTRVPGAVPVDTSRLYVVAGPELG